MHHISKYTITWHIGNVGSIPTVSNELLEAASGKVQI